MTTLLLAVAVMTAMGETASRTTVKGTVEMPVRSVTVTAELPLKLLPLSVEAFVVRPVAGQHAEGMRAFHAHVHCLRQRRPDQQGLPVTRPQAMLQLIEGRPAGCAETMSDGWCDRRAQWCPTLRQWALLKVCPSAVSMVQLP